MVISLTHHQLEIPTHLASVGLALERRPMFSGVLLKIVDGDGEMYELRQENIQSPWDFLQVP